MRLLILGTGWMAEEHARQFSRIEGVELVGAVDLDRARVEKFSDSYAIPNRFASLEDALAWDKFDAVANVTPDRIHHPTTMMLIAAGKPVLCEKPLAENYQRASEMADVAEQAGIINMVNLTYRNVAPLQRARAMVLAGEIGTVRHVEASYLQIGRFDVPDRADLDANDSFTMALDFSNGAFGVVHASRWATGHLNELRLRIYGDKGGIEVVHNLTDSELKACMGEDIENAKWQVLDAGTVATNYQRFVDAVRNRVQAEPSFRHAAELQKVLDLAVVSDEKRAELRTHAETH
ncbi:MAG: Gfo/Idh/MocA family oxidoreductase [Mesorhizobium sp.]|nr:MAG: Gfo/Idh/MocA family oxidoreductase [Mesorhizobium sp.]